MDLPEAQKELYDYLVLLPPHVAPSIRDLADVMGVHYTAIQKRLERLQAKGLVSWTPGASRTLQVVRPGQVWVAVPNALVAEVAGLIAGWESRQRAAREYTGSAPL